MEKLKPILNKESILKTANSEEIRLHPAEVQRRYAEYASTHIPLGDTTEQLSKLKRVITVNVKCAVGTIVGPYGYGKTSTAVHMWDETSKQKILSVPPFVWNSLDQLITGVYYWVDHELGNGAAHYQQELKGIFARYSSMALSNLMDSLGLTQEQVDAMRERGVLSLELKALDVVNFLDDVSKLVLQAGYVGMVIYTDELQVTLSNYISRDLFFSHLFDMVSNLIDRQGKWAWILTMNNDVESTFSIHRGDLLQRLQSSALHFRVEKIYNNTEYARELWKEFEKRFDFSGSGVITSDTLTSIGQIASRADLGAGPRMVTHTMALGIAHYEQTGSAYSPFNVVDDFLKDRVIFDTLGKFPKATQEALNHVNIRDDEQRQQLIKLIAAFPLGVNDQMLQKFELKAVFDELPPLARQELLQQLAGGYILRGLSEVLTPPESIVETLTKNFVNSFTANKKYAIEAANGFYKMFVENPLFGGWEVERPTKFGFDGEDYISTTVRGTFDRKYPDRIIHIMVTALEVSKTPNFEKANAQADLEYRFEFNYGLEAETPSRMLIDPEGNRVVVFQLNLKSTDPALAENTLPAFLLPYYTIDQFTPLLTMSLAYYLDKNKGDQPMDKSQVDLITSNMSPYFQKLLLGAGLVVSDQTYANGAVGQVKIQELFKAQCRKLYPDYLPLAYTKNWENHLQKYNNALSRMEAGYGISIIRGRAELKISKGDLVDCFQVTGRSLTQLENLLNELKGMGLVELINYSGTTVTAIVTIKMTVHPFEQHILDLIEASTDRVKVNQDHVNAIEHKILIQAGKMIGYTMTEVNKLIEILKFRKWIQFEERSGKLYRVIDDINEMREALIKQCEIIDANAKLIADNFLSFESAPYYMGRKIEDLKKAQDQDQIESVKVKIREAEAGIKSFTLSNSNIDIVKIRDIENAAFRFSQGGNQEWLNRPIPESPLKNLLEVYRTSKLGEFTRLVERARTLKDRISNVRMAIAQNAEQLVQNHQFLLEQNTEMEKITTAANTFHDQKLILDDWNQVAKFSEEVNNKAKNIRDKHGDPEYVKKVEQLLVIIGNEQQGDPFGFYQTSGSTMNRFSAIAKGIDNWEGTHRKTFTDRCAMYQQVLESAGIKSALTIPFDPDHSQESYGMLYERVSAEIDSAIASLESALSRISAKIKYGKLIQNLDLQNVESVASGLKSRLIEFRRSATKDTIEKVEGFSKTVVEPLKKGKAEIQTLFSTVEDLVKKKPASGFETRFQEAVANNMINSKADLRAIIIELMETKGESIDQDKILEAMISLFHKNQLIVEIIPTTFDE
jgi:hypothetical protein